MISPSASADLVAVARSLADSVLAPAAVATDQAPVVPREHLEALAAAGLCGLAGPVEAGGWAAPPVVVREVYEALAGACGVTFFVWVQHHAPVRLLARSSNWGLRERWLPELCSGSVLGRAGLRLPATPGAAGGAGPPGVAWLLDLR